MPILLSALGWLAIAVSVWTALEADRTASSLMLAIAAAAGVVAVLLQSLALSIHAGRSVDAMLAELRRQSQAANDSSGRL